MTNLEIKIDAVEPFAEGRAFGEAGSYLRVRGTAKGELDPAAPQNQVIVDLDKAPRNARGLVEYETDFFMLRPEDPRRTNGVLGGSQLGTDFIELDGLLGEHRGQDLQGQEDQADLLHPPAAPSHPRRVSSSTQTRIHRPGQAIVQQIR